MTLLTAGGVALGLLFGVATRLVLKLMHRRGHKAPEQVALTLAMAYLSFYVANGPAKCSGPICTVVFGLFGSATNKWSMSPRVVESGTFDTFWDTLSFAFNGLVFFYSGASVVNFTWRSSDVLFKTEGNLTTLLFTFWRLPLVYFLLLATRFFCITLFNPLFHIANQQMSWREIVFTTFAGLRGAVSLILAQVVVTQQAPDMDVQMQRVTAELALWTAGIVVFTLLVNAPLTPLLLRKTGLSEVSRTKARARAKAARALVRYTKTALTDLQNDKDEMLRGVDWAQVEREVDLRSRLKSFAPSESVSLRSPEALETIQEGEEDGGEGQHKQGARLKQARSSSKKTAEWVADAASALGHALGRRFRDSSDGGCRTPLLQGHNGGFDEEMGRVAEEQPSANSPPDEDLQGMATQPSLLLAPFSPARGPRGEAVAPQGEQLPIQDLLSKPVEQLARTEEVPMDMTELAAQNLDKEMPGPSPAPGGGSSWSMNEGFSSATTAEPPHLPLSMGPSTPPRAKLEASPSQEASQPIGAELGGSQRAARPWHAAKPPLKPPLKSPFEESAAGGAEGSPAPSQVGASGPSEVAEKDASATAPGTPDTIWQPIIMPQILKPGEEGTGPPEKPFIWWVSLSLRESGRRRRLEDPQGGQEGRVVLRVNGVGSDSGFQRQKLPQQPDEHRRDDSRHNLHIGLSLHRSMSSQVPKGGASKDRGSAKDRATQQAEEDDEAEEAAADKEDRDEDNEELLAEARVRLVSGLKRYFHMKRAQGLLSNRGLQVLDYACNTANDESDKPLALWKIIEREACHKSNSTILSRLLFGLRTLKLRATAWQLKGFTRRIVYGPLDFLDRWVSGLLAQTLLLALEVAIEFWLALRWSPQAQWLASTPGEGTLQKEVKDESGTCWSFIIEREVEAPARFSAIQTHRACMAVIRQQVGFVEQLWSSGVIDERERELMLEPLDKMERRLIRHGPAWQPPPAVDVLKSLPFLHDLPQPAFEYVLSHSRLLKCSPGQVIRPAVWDVDLKKGDSEGGQAQGYGIYTVMVGLLRSSYRTSRGANQEFYLGSGGGYGLLSALVGQAMPGSGACVAVGNALQQGPVLFHMPQELIEDIRQQAASGDPDMQQLELDMFRVAALYVVERLKGEVEGAAMAYAQGLALQQARRRTLQRLHAHHKRGHANTNKTAGEVWQLKGGSQKAQEVMHEELLAALENPLCLQNGGDGAATSADQTAKDAKAMRADFASLRRNDAKGAVGPSDEDLVSCVEPRRLWKTTRSLAREALESLKQGLRDATVLQLGPHQRFDQQSSVVLLRGTLEVVGRARESCQAAIQKSGAKEGSGGPSQATPAPYGISVEGLGEGKGDGAVEVVLRYRGPTVLPWLWNALTDGSKDVLLQPQPITHTAGGEGAVLVVCQPESADPDGDSSDVQSTDTPSSSTTDLINAIARPSGEPGSRRRSPSPPRGHTDRATPHRAHRLPGCGADEAPQSEGPPLTSSAAAQRLQVVSITAMEGQLAS